MTSVEILYIGGPTSVITLGGVRLLTDPTFDAPGEYAVGSRTLVKKTGPAVTAAEVGPVDAVLLSHDHHPDNLDTAGRTLVGSAPLVLSTASAYDRIGAPVRALPTWEHTEVGGVRVTAVPALHGPKGSEPLVGEVTGFVLSGAGLPKVYVSGDNADLDLVREIADREGPFDVAVLFAGAARTPLVPDAPLTLTSERAAEAAVILGARHVVPLHFEHWGHFTQDGPTLTKAFAEAGLTDRLHLPEPGETVRL
ncbi:MBL fold metallo-hydrolase [Streptomyces justiciae]|uniref:MBL fold metallo-hydrolase n=1 Tax=Streptomyces justiciae TaxID=2780140 RepID=A0ABU3M1I6_9ACTN|nr:MBL fold metallo-hydrolase [Streptomyces justiciae]MBE8475660.1 MBL fold metallo-hydrolase [Streptomyces justiciae]MCW8384389.1 MBL fold metallo-hydrolase [Streptomyces justiciae]MDT7844657.1 MBL fold metallo-hydrolase [Streptomyces justiciae]